MARKKFKSWSECANICTVRKLRLIPRVFFSACESRHAVEQPSHLTKKPDRSWSVHLQTILVTMAANIPSFLLGFDRSPRPRFGGAFFFTEVGASPGRIGAGTRAVHRRCPGMTAERQKRAEWEWLLLGCAPSNRDLPQHLREFSGAG